MTEQRRSDVESAPILAAALDAVITIDEDGCVVELNPAAEELFGYSRPEALGQRVSELVIPPGLRAAHCAGLERVLAGGPSKILGRRVELTAMRAQGAEFPIELAVTRTAQTPPRFTAWIRDLSERTAAEAEVTRRKALLERAERLARIGSWEWTPATDEFVWSDNLFRLFGLQPGEVAPSLEVLAARVHPDDRGKVEHEMESARGGGALPPLDVRVVRPDGTVCHLRATGVVEKRAKDEPRRLVGSVQDVTEQRHAEREMAAHLAVSEALSAWSSLEQGAERLLRDLCTALDYSVGVLWLPQGDVLVARLFFNVAGTRTPEYERATRELRLPKGLGLPGQAWERREPVDAEHLIGEIRFGRDEAAARDGLTCGLAIPAHTGDEVLAVFELCAKDDAELTDRLMQLLTGLGYELGAFLAHRRGELKPPPLTERQLEILQLAARGGSGREIAAQLVISPATVKTHFEHIYAKLGVSDRAAAVAYALREGLIE